MKKIILFASALAGLFLAASCQQESLEPQAAKETVTLTVQTPEVMQTKAIADGQNVDELVYEVWITNDGYGVLSSDKTKTQKLYQAITGVQAGKATIQLDLLKDQKYTILFWAQVAAADAYLTGELTEVKYAKATYKANEESLAAFYGVAYVNEANQAVDKNGLGTGGKVTLTRPFAQINLGTLNNSTKLDEAGKPVIGYGIEVLRSSLMVTNVPNSFNVLDGNVSDAASTITFELDELPFQKTSNNPELPADKTLTVNGTAYEYVGMNYIFAGDNVEVTYAIESKLNGGIVSKLDNTISSVPVEKNYRTNIIGNLLTSKTDYEIIIDSDFVGEEIVEVTAVSSNEDLLAALKKNDEHIFIDLYSVQAKSVAAPQEFVIPVAGSGETHVYGGENTKTITINGNGNIIKFEHTDGDTNCLRSKNSSAVWYINNAHLTNTGKNNGPWNRHDVGFGSAVELTDVTSDKAIALYSAGKLVNVSICDEHVDNSEAYGLWIRPVGQVVDIDNLTIVPHSTKTTDRAITINDQHLSEQATVTLNIKNSTFVSQKKAAVLVKANSGAIINWGKGNDISGVKADAIHAVWVDKDRNNPDAVTVNGALVTIEGKSVFSEGAVVKLPAGSVNIPDISADNVTLIGSEEGTELNVGATSFTGDNVTIKNLTIVNDGKNKTPISLSGKNPVIENCTFVGAAGNGYGIVVSGNGHGADNVITLKNCDFSGDDFFKPVFDGWSGLGGGTLLIEGCNLSNGLYAMHIDANSQDGTVIVRDSYLAGFITNGASLTSVTFERCTFGEANGYACINVYTSHSFIDCVFPTKADANNVSNYGLYFTSNAKGDLMTVKNCRMSDGTVLTRENCEVAKGGFFHWDSDTEACVWNWLGTVEVTASEGSVALENIDEALKAGNDVLLSTDVTAGPAITAPYGNKVGVVVPAGSVFDGNGNTVSVTGGGDNYAVMTYGGLIKNVNIADGFRGVVIMSPSEDIYLENVVSAGSGVGYAINTTEGDSSKNLYATNCTFKGWNSWANIKSATFTGCHFGQGTYWGETSVYGRIMRPYVTTVFDGCSFESGEYLDLSALIAGHTVTIRNCTVDGVAVTRDTFNVVESDESVIEGKLWVENAEAFANSVIFE